MEHYGNGPSTGMDQTAAGKIETGFTPEWLEMHPDDKAVLRQLAERVAGIAASTRMREVRRHWHDINALRSTRPIVFCDPENGWNEIITEKQMLCRGRLARRWEMDLRKEVFWGEEMGDDKPVEPFFDVPYTVSPDDWGLAPVYHKTDAAGSYVWDPPIRDYATDLAKLHAPTFEIDEAISKATLDIAKDVFDDLLPVRRKGTWWWSLGLTWRAATLRGLNSLFLDLVDCPDGLSELLSILSRGLLAKLDRLEREGLLSLNNDGTYVGSGGFGFTDELPSAEYKQRQAGQGSQGSQGGQGSQGSQGPRCRDLWGFTESQETVNVSPAMYRDYIFVHEKPLMERFGLTCYGCCEPLHTRWDIVRRHHGLRRVSISPWCNLEKMAEAVEDKYVMSVKPNPAALAVPEIDEQALRMELRRIFEITRGCVVEVIMKDNHTIGGRPENVVQWCRIAKEESLR